MIRRREFIAGLGSAAVWPMAVRAQQAERMRRIGVILAYEENDPVAKPRYSAFTRALADLGWTGGRNLRVDIRWGGGDTNRIRALTQELVGLQPEAILASGTPATAAAPSAVAMPRTSQAPRFFECNVWVSSVASRHHR